MMPVVRVSDQTWERLQKHATPLVDTVDTVISAALDALDAAKGEPKPGSKGLLTKFVEQQRQKKGEMTPQREFRQPLLKTLLELGGTSPVSKIKEALQKKIQNTLKPGDHKFVSSGDVRWWNAVCWERASLVREGLFRSDSPRGVWELTERGKAEAKKPDRYSAAGLWT